MRSDSDARARDPSKRNPLAPVVDFGHRRRVSIVAALGLMVLLGVVAIVAPRLEPNREGVAGEATITSATVAPAGQVVAGPPLIPNDMAIERLVYVICAHEAACGQANGTVTARNGASPTKSKSEGESENLLVGDEDCSRIMRVGLGMELDQAEACQGGIIAAQLDQCVAEIEKEPCGPSPQTPMTLALCRAVSLCSSL